MWTTFVTLDPRQPVPPGQERETWLERLVEAREVKGIECLCEGVGLESVSEAGQVCEPGLQLRSF